MLAMAGGCSRDKPHALAVVEDGSTDGSARSGPSSSGPSIPGASPGALAAKADAGRPSWRTAPVFSAPIGGLRRGGTTLVAGMVSGAGVLRVVGFRPDGSSWTRDVMTGLGADPEAEVKLDRAGADDVALVWKGKAAGESTKLAVLGVAGELRSDPQDIGAEWCTTADGVAWVENRPHGVAHVAWRSWNSGPSRDVASIGSGRTPAVVCGDHDVFTLGDGDDDLTAAVFVPGETNARPPSVILRGADFDDEELEHRVYTVADELQIVRVAESGALSLREVPASGPPRAWRRIKHRMGQDEDIVAVDGDSTATLIVATQAREDDCPNAASPAERVGALRIDRASGTVAAVELAAPDCARSLGPFWIAPQQPNATSVAVSGPLVAWIDRRAELVAGAAAVRGLTYVVLRPKRPEIGHLDVDADEVVDAGCDGSGCYAAALIRAEAQAQDSAAPTTSARSASAQPSSIVVMEYL
ncbi:MAG TPA: hypothetical protein VEK07_04935 [Polyangiaceae bacterium]|nr:hypothetical protein [Polyangiaceae bacterium]